MDRKRGMEVRNRMYLETEKRRKSEWVDDRHYEVGLFYSAKQIRFEYTFHPYTDHLLPQTNPSQKAIHMFPYSDKIIVCDNGTGVRHLLRTVIL